MSEMGHEPCLPRAAFLITDDNYVRRSRPCDWCYVQHRIETSANMKMPPPRAAPRRA
jgi:hypothetical protein